MKSTLLILVVLALWAAHSSSAKEAGAAAAKHPTMRDKMMHILKEDEKRKRLEEKMSHYDPKADLVRSNVGKQIYWLSDRLDRHPGPGWQNGKGLLPTFWKRYGYYDPMDLYRYRQTHHGSIPIEKS